MITTVRIQAQAQARAQAAILAALILASSVARAAEGCARVEVQNVRPQQGFLMLAAFADEAGFGNRPVTSLRLASGDATMRFELCGLSGTQTALTLYQDLDGDGRMGRNLLGMPTEPWGASGDPGTMGPSWATTHRALDGQVLVVRMSQ